ncbi:MAG TPA: radical SAM protein [bacterium]|nr:radical SAM protein [bacterium]
MIKQKRFSRVLLVSPPSSSYLGAARPPQNLGYLAESLFAQQIDYDVLDMRLGYGFSRLRKKIETYRPDLVGFSLVSLEYKRSYDLIARTKSVFPDLPVVTGGPHLTVLQSQVLEECPAIDFGVVYEGENTLLELCDASLGLSEIKGLIRKNRNRIVYNGNREYERNLDLIPFPTYRKFELNRYIRELPLNSSRGCPYRCVFCPNKMITKRFRWRSAQHVADEIAFWVDRGYRVFNFDDDNFTFHKDRVYDICDEIEKRGIRHAEFRCSNGLRADRVDEPLLKRMRSVGFNYIAFGVDGGNDKMLTANKKGETLSQIDDAVRTACALGYDVKIFCILGMPRETQADTEDAFRFVQKYPVRRVILNNPIPYPGTELYETVLKNNWFIIEPEHYLNEVTENINHPVFTTPEMGYGERIALMKKARKIEKRVTRRAVQSLYSRWFPVNYLLAGVFATGLVERMFFENRWFRQWIENMRYRRMFSRSPGPEKRAL